jgi:phage recombination protein Bet
MRETWCGWCGEGLDDRGLRRCTCASPTTARVDDREVRMETIERSSVPEPKVAAIQMPQPYFSQQQVALVKSQIAKGASDDELALFLGTCQRLRLDPFARQIFFVKRRERQRDGTYAEVGGTQVSIDGFRVVAERSGSYQGQTRPEWCGHDGRWREVWLAREPPAAARVGVHRKGFQDPIYAVARWDSFVQTKGDGTPVRMWSQLPDIMLAKCAEAQALRRAFPNDLSGVYAPEELAHADVIDVAPAPKPAAKRKQQPKLSDAREADEVLAWARANREPLARTDNAKRAQADEQLRAACARVGADEREVLAMAGLAAAVEDAVARREAHDAHASAEEPVDVGANEETRVDEPSEETTA